MLAGTVELTMEIVQGVWGKRAHLRAIVAQRPLNKTVRRQQEAQARPTRAASVKLALGGRAVQRRMALGRPLAGAPARGADSGAIRSQRIVARQSHQASARNNSQQFAQRPRGGARGPFCYAEGNAAAHDCFVAADATSVRRYCASSALGQPIKFNLSTRLARKKSNWDRDPIASLVRHHER